MGKYIGTDPYSDIEKQKGKPNGVATLDANGDVVQNPADLKDTTDPAKGDALIGFRQSGTGAVARTVHDKLGEFVSVKDFGAVGDGVADDTAAIQAALNASEFVLFPAGVYLVNPIANTTPIPHGVQVPSKRMLLFSEGAVIKAMANSADSYAIMAGIDASDIIILGGVFEGDRATHTGTTGEWGFGLDLRGCNNIKLIGTVFKDCWGDGLYVDISTSSGAESSDIVSVGCMFLNNRRNNVSIIGCLGARFADCAFKSASGTAPECGVDLEQGSNVVKDISFEGCFFEANNRAGLMVNGASNVAISGCQFRGNNAAGVAGYGDLYIVSAGSSHVALSANTFDTSGHQAIYCNGPSYVTINGCTVRQPGRDGILVQDSSSIIISNNVVEQAGLSLDNTYSGINVIGATSFCTVSGNIVRLGASGNNQQYGIRVSLSAGTDTVSVVGNTAEGVTGAYYNANGFSLFAGNQPNHHKVLTSNEATPDVLGVRHLKLNYSVPTDVIAFKNGVYGQVLTVELAANATLVHDGVNLRLAGGVNFTGSGPDIITLVCIIGGADSQFAEVSRSDNL